MALTIRYRYEQQTCLDKSIVILARNNDTFKHDGFSNNALYDIGCLNFNSLDMTLNIDRKIDTRFYFFGTLVPYRLRNHRRRKNNTRCRIADD